MFYTYAHTRNDTGEIFYIGKGQRSRAHSRCGRGVLWNRVADKHGFEAVVLARWATEKEALDHEVFLIQCMRSMGLRLANLTDGGEGVSGFRKSASERARQSATSRLAWADPEDRARRVEAQRAASSTPEARARLRAAARGKNQGVKDAAAAHLRAMNTSKAKPVIHLDTGIEYPSCAAAAAALGGHKSSIKQVCLGYHNSTRGMRFMFAPTGSPSASPSPD